MTRLSRASRTAPAVMVLRSFASRTRSICVMRVRGDQIPVDFFPEQRVDMLVAGCLIRPVEHRVAQPAHNPHNSGRPV